MKTHSNILLFLFAIGLCVSVAVLSSKPINSEVLLGNDKSANGLIAGYKHWTQVNSEPLKISSWLSGLCAIPSASQINMWEKQNPHHDKFVVVYVNDVGKEAMMEQRLPVFPEGSVIVKEKLTAKDSTSPELLTVMRKREAGYDPDNGNWEYLVFDGAGQKAQANGKLEKCQACHLSQKATDYVARNYLPANVAVRLH